MDDPKIEPKMPLTRIKKIYIYLNDMTLRNNKTNYNRYANLIK